MTQPKTSGGPSPYRLETPPRSRDCVLLSRVLEEFAAVEWGYSSEDIARVFETRGGDGLKATALDIASAAGTITDAILQGHLRTYVRAYGGGPQDELPVEAWEIDDPILRFASSAIDPTRPFDRAAQPTHWILVAREDAEAMLQQLCGIHLLPQELATSAAPTLSADQPLAETTVDALPARRERLLRLGEVLTRTGLSRSTLYDKVAKRTFPQPIRQGTRLTSWRESEVAAWIEGLM